MFKFTESCWYNMMIVFLMMPMIGFMATMGHIKLSIFLALTQVPHFLFMFNKLQGEE